jgi:hypothetical protein
MTSWSAFSSVLSKSLGIDDEISRNPASSRNDHERDGRIDIDALRVTRKTE